MKPSGPLFRNLTFVCLGLALAGHFAAPNFLGFTVLPLLLALIFALVAGWKRWRADFSALFSRRGRYNLRLAAWLALGLALALAAGSSRFLPAFEVSENRLLSLSPDTLDLLAKLDRPVAITIHLGAQHPALIRVRELMAHYERAGSGHFTISYVNPQTEAANGDAGPRLVAPETALVEADGFRENVSPITEEALNGALTRLLHPDRRLVYFLNTFGEKMVGDQGPGGLSRWAEDLGGRRILALDYHWLEGQPLPPEASALVLAGPRAPLGQFREAMLLSYLTNGGKLMILADPLTVALSPDFWAPFGLKYPDGLVVDPETNLAGTDETFIAANDYPGHPLTRGLAGPTIWPIAGALQTLAEDGHAALPATAYAVAMTSASAWLETNPASLRDGSLRYQPDQDIPGPLALAVAVEIEGGGRLLALADSDLAANSFQGFPGNRNLTGASLHWLLDGQSATLTVRDSSQSLAFGRTSARLVFWLPAVVWPALVVSLWFIYYRRRRLGG
ncbi:GldG family protein [Deltaproteobacteria bacterium OttesenSCG-928-M10]|nr:GldG family protein [Deltaproteobacteria bacterium OttesenSCG-928-M10]